MLSVVCLQLVVSKWIAHTHNAFGRLLLYVAHHDEEFVELLASGHWLEELLVEFDSLSSANLDLSLTTASHISDTVIVATTSTLLSISNQFSNSSFDMPSGAWGKISLVRSDSLEAGVSAFVLEKSTFSEAVFNSLL